MRMSTSIAYIYILLVLLYTYRYLSHQENPPAGEYKTNTSMLYDAVTPSLCAGLGL